MIFKFRDNVDNLNHQLIPKLFAIRRDTARAWGDDWPRYRTLL
jgi:hypothetical protein